MQALLLANSQPRRNPRRRLATAECETDVAQRFHRKMRRSFSPPRDSGARSDKKSEREVARCVLLKIRPLRSAPRRPKRRSIRTIGES
jgi:hypothetical protein